ncbi:hypothetical protein CYMTET_54331 [Cymbomonas tetramitiformis]|uniref:Uncharacterized protein n=1 Tax=Cymbomonas tetramitiformis TaxID=36881 RepID=A0AAE0BGW1_9CHLO|nr:hypothetical protein CYMTET_54331 [Cymbomonas tetramitiformis]|eukprot:gene16619-19743_t
MPFGTSRIALDAKLNLTVTENYVSDWNVWEGIRELYQNFKDGIVTAGRADGVQPEEMGRTLIREEPGTYAVQFARTSHPQTVYGEIKLENGVLVLANKGRMTRQCLLLGGSDAGKHSVNDKEIAGRFGEGMKLASLALARTEKDVTIKTGDEQWTFDLTIDHRFGDKKCLYVTLDKRPSPMAEHDFTEVVIKGIKDLEWKMCRAKFLDLAPDDKPLVDTPHGRIILDKSAEVFVKGIFVKSNPGVMGDFGFDFYDVALDRDRKAVTNVNQLYLKGAQILAHCLINNSEMCQDPELPAATRELLRALPSQVYTIVKGNASDWMSPLAAILRVSKVVFSSWFDNFRREHPEKQPTTTAEQRATMKHFKEQTVVVNQHLYEVLSRDPRFISIKKMQADVEEKQREQARTALAKLRQQDPASLSEASKNKAGTLAKMLKELFKTEHRVEILSADCDCNFEFPVLETSTNTFVFKQPFLTQLPNLLAECVRRKQELGEDVEATAVCKKLGSMVLLMSPTSNRVPNKRKRDGKQDLDSNEDQYES